MPLERIETVNLGSRTFDSIRDAILSGELTSKAVLSDRTLGDMLGVSRTPVREALHRLEDAGLVQSHGRSGWVVTEFTAKDVRELFQLRRALEPLGLLELQRNPDPRTLKELGGFFDSYHHPIPLAQYTKYFARDANFHRRLIESSGNGRLIHMYDALEAHIARGRHVLSLGASGRVDETLDEHQAVTTAIANGDLEAARVALLHHLDMGEQLMVDHVEKAAG